MCLAGLKERYRQHHAAILHGQTAFDTILASEGGVLPGDRERSPEKDQEDGAGGQRQDDSELVRYCVSDFFFLIVGRQSRRSRQGGRKRTGADCWILMVDPRPPHQSLYVLGQGLADTPIVFCRLAFVPTGLVNSITIVLPLRRCVVPSLPLSSRRTTNNKTTSTGGKRRGFCGRARIIPWTGGLR